MTSQNPEQFELPLSPDAHGLQSIQMDDATVSLHRQFLDAASADQIFPALRDTLAWEQPVIRMFGKTVNSPRLHAWYGDSNAAYRWSGRTWQPNPWCDVLLQLRQQVEKAVGVSFNSCLANRYRSGNDAMGLHADDESELGETPVIASLSFGVSREFVFRHRSQKNERVSVLLEHGSLLVMAGDTQQNWKHEIRRSRRITQERINLTFRTVYSDGAI